MGRRPCCDNIGLNKGAWTAEEDKKLVNFVLTNYKCSWRDVPKHAGLLRCGKSCRLRWVNYLRPDLKRGLLTQHEEKLVIDLHSQFGNKWSKIASHMPGRTDNEIKNLWNTHIKKKLSKMGIDPLTHKPLNAYPPPDNHHKHYQSQEAELPNGEETQEHHKDQEDEISLNLEESTITHTDDQLAKEQELMDTNNGFLQQVPMNNEPDENNDNAFSIYEVPIIEPYEPDENNDNAFSIYEIPIIEPYKNTEDGFSTHEVMLSESNENTNNDFSTHEVPLIKSNDNIDECFFSDAVPSIELEEPDENTNNNFFIHEFQSIEPEETLRPDLSSSCSSTTCSNTNASTTISILEDLKSLQSFEDWQSGGHKKLYIENSGVTCEDDFSDWNWLINDFDIDTIDFELIRSLPDPVSLKNSLG
ncbi:hypothetical protein DCAR_0521240 [Daucus carota subsp. sativus]|uniref:Uncharacterized protein n=1 Tax=Daucus carota subsp. sativus TaxID=79200 RepID=A0A162A4P6_DAUCS|nr:PREDICTED: myb-related protein 315-like [Daucus carota subsp. sativus]WOH01854.1 hypothetical protein DCAR_0521240 [Daucus carota subsp. sativus]